MSTSGMRDFLAGLRQLALCDDDGLSDGTLLETYVQSRDEPALSALVRRHSTMVWGVCRRVLGGGQDAEDAFQTTFVVLVRKAASIRDRTKVANWLYGVAQQTAVRMRALRAKQGAREKQVGAMPEGFQFEQQLCNDLTPILDEELGRLPDKYRTLIVLCDLEEKSRSEVARQLGCPEGTVAGRLARARALLADRLTRRGVPTTAAVLAAVFAALPATAAPTALVASTINMATTGALSATVAVLTKGVLQSMFLNKLKLPVAILLAVLTVGAGGLLVYAATRTPVIEPAPIAAPANEPEKDKKPAAKKQVDPKITMVASAPQFQRPDPENLPDFSYWEVKVQFKNDGKEEAVLYPFLKVKVFDAAGKPVQRDAFIGRGLYPPNILDDEVEPKFLVVAPGKTKDIVVNLGYHNSALEAQGWHFKKPGTYKVEISYQFTRQGFEKEYYRAPIIIDDKDLQRAKQPQRLWNRAVEMQKTVTVEVKVAK